MSDIHFSLRWDFYFKNQPRSGLRVLSFLTSFLIAVILFLIIGYIFCRTIKKDVDIYNEVIYNI